MKAGERGQVRPSGDSCFISRRALQEARAPSLKGSLAWLVRTGAKGETRGICARSTSLDQVLQVPHLQRR